MAVTNWKFNYFHFLRVIMNTNKNTYSDIEIMLNEMMSRSDQRSGQRSCFARREKSDETSTDV